MSQLRLKMARLSLVQTTLDSPNCYDSSSSWRQKPSVDVWMKPSINSNDESYNNVKNLIDIWHLSILYLVSV